MTTLAENPERTEVDIPPAPVANVPRPKRPRIRILDGLRLLAALLVLSWHYVAFGHGSTHTPYARVPVLYPVAAYGWLGVELFFMISGFVICMSSMGHTLREFVTSRITRLYPAYWFGIALTTLVLTLWPVERSALPWSNVFLNLTMFQSGFGVASVDAVYWTLWAELHFYLLFAIVVWRGVTYRSAVTFCGTWLAVAFVATRVGGVFDNLVVGDWAPFFVAGVAFFLMHRFGQKPLLWGYVVVSFLMGIHPVLRTLDGSNTHLQNKIPQWPAVVVMALFYVLMAGIAFGWLRASWRWLGVAGAITYPLYLIHEFIGWAIMKALDPEVPGPVLYVGTLALMVALAWLIHRYVERPLAARLKRGVRATFAVFTGKREVQASLR